jgi:hypothetical protein
MTLGRYGHLLPGLGDALDATHAESAPVDNVAALPARQQRSVRGVVPEAAHRGFPAPGARIVTRERISRDAPCATLQAPGTSTKRRDSVRRMCRGDSAASVTD